MKRRDVPQNRALLGDFKEVTYATDDDGDYVLENSVGWAVKTAANSQYWRSVRDSVRTAVAAIRNGQASKLCYHMAVHQMDRALIASYVGMSRWRVARHMKPGPFSRLSERIVERYSAVFGITPDELRRLPDDADKPEALRRWAELDE